jgi:hypothetical protein
MREREKDYDYDYEAAHFARENKKGRPGACPS